MISTVFLLELSGTCMDLISPTYSDVHNDIDVTSLQSRSTRRYSKALSMNDPLLSILSGYFHTSPNVSGT